MTEFNENLPQWEKEGVEPPADYRTTRGFEFKDKPPASWINWFFNRIYKVLQELQGNATHLTDFNAHLAETVSQYFNIARDLTLTGPQVISGFSKKPKGLDIIAMVQGTPQICWGKVAQNGRYGACILANGDSFTSTSFEILLGDSGNYTRGQITINSDNTITIDWSHAGTGGTGNATIRLIALYHGTD